MNEALSKRLTFDYGGVATHQVKSLKETAHEVRKLTIDIGRNGWLIGDRFRRAKEVVQHGQFESWLAAECDGYTVRTAQRLMRLREAYDSPEKITFGQTAALILAEEGVPESAREEARKIAAEGKPVTKATARKIVAEAKPKPAEPPKKAETLKSDTGVGNRLQDVDSAYDAPVTAPTVIETTAKTVSSEPTATDILKDLSPVLPRLRKVKEDLSGQPFDHKTASQHVACVVNLLEGETPTYRLVKAGDAGAQAAEVFDAYPRKVGRDKALVTIRNALKRKPFDELLEAVKEYARSREGKDPQFTPHPATWFGEGRWDDDRSEWFRAEATGRAGKAQYKPGPGERFDPNAELGSL